MALFVSLLAIGCKPTVLVVGLDGANWELLDPLIDEGYLPTIGGLVRDGVSADLDCRPAGPEFACFCPPVWTTLATGRTTAEHRIGSFFDPSDKRRVKAIWNIVDEYDGIATLVSYRGTWPPEPGIDYVFTEPGLDALGAEMFTTWGTITPHPALEEPDPLYHPMDLPQQLGLLPHEGERPDSWDWFARDRAAMEGLLRLVESRPPPEPLEQKAELTMITIHGTDKVEHRLWDGIQTDMYAPYEVATLLGAAEAWSGPVLLPGPEPDGIGEIADAYIEVDEWLSALLAEEHYDYVVFVSDHGMTRSFETANPGHHSVGLTEAHVGILSITGPGVRKGVRLDVVDVLDFAPTLAYLLELPVAEDLPGGVVEAAFTPEQLANFPIRTTPSWEDEEPSQ